MTTSDKPYHGFPVPWWISSDSRFTLNERLMLAFLVDEIPKSGNTLTLTDKFLTERFGWSRKTSHLTIKSLCEKHLVRCTYPRRKGLRSPLRTVEVNLHRLSEIKAAHGSGADRCWWWDYSLVTNTDFGTREIATYGIIREFARTQEYLSRSQLRKLAGISVDSEDLFVRKFRDLGLITVKHSKFSKGTVRTFSVNTGTAVLI